MLATPFFSRMRRRHEQLHDAFDLDRARRAARRAGAAPALRREHVMRRISPDAEALRLLKLYLGTLGGDETTLSTPDVQRAVIDHVTILWRSPSERRPTPWSSARARGLAAGRLAAIRADVRESRGHGSGHRRRGAPHRPLAAPGAAVVPRARPDLFGLSEGAAPRARAAYADEGPLRASERHAVAYEAGFGDLSHFNHASAVASARRLRRCGWRRGSTAPPARLRTARRRFGHWKPLPALDIASHPFASRSRRSS